MGFYSVWVTPTFSRSQSHAKAVEFLIIRFEI